MPRLKTLGKWVGLTVLILILMITVAYTYVYIQTEKRINKQYSFVEENLNIPADSLSILKGKHIYQIRGCADCHGANLGGGEFQNDKMLLQLSAPNLTKGEGGLPASYSGQDWVRVFRYGLDKNGNSLWLMPSHETTVLSKEDLSNLIAYCQSVPPVNSNQEKLKKIGPIGRLVMMMDDIVILPAERIDHRAEIADYSPVEKIAYGQYLAVSCQGCHRANLKGGGPLVPGFPPVPDITTSGAPGKWTNEQFIATLRNGKTPDGRFLRNEFMPWQNMNHFSDEELTAIGSYLQSLR